MRRGDGEIRALVIHLTLCEQSAAVSQGQFSAKPTIKTKQRPAFGAQHKPWHDLFNNVKKRAAAASFAVYDADDHKTLKSHCSSTVIVAATLSTATCVK